MAKKDEFVVATDITAKYSYRMTQLERALHSNNVRIAMNKEIVKAVTPYIPNKTGALANDVTINPKYVIWGKRLQLPYARYQYYGINYVANVPGKIFGQKVFRSPAGVKKRPDDSVMGGKYLGSNPGRHRVYPKFIVDNSGYRKATPQDSYFYWNFGYTNPLSQREWVNVYKERLKAETNRKISASIKPLLRAKYG